MVEQFPLTPSGKVQKFMLRERFLAQGPDVAIRAESPDISAGDPTRLMITGAAHRAPSNRDCGFPAVMLLISSWGHLAEDIVGGGPGG